MSASIESIKNNIINGLSGFKGINPYVIGVDIGSSTLKVALIRLGQNPVLYFYSIADIPEGSPDGYITERIRKIVKDSDITSNNAVLIFSDEHIVIRRVEIPSMAPNEILGALKWRAKEMVHFDMDEAVVDFEIIGERQQEDSSRVTDLVFVAVSKDAADRYVKIVKDAGLDIVAVNVSSFGLANLFKGQIKEESQKTVLVCDMGSSKTEVSVFKDGLLQFTRILPVASGAISDAMTTSLVAGGNNVSFSRAEAEDLKIALGIPYETQTLENGVTSIQLLSLMRSVLERLSKEIRLSTDYYMQEFGGEEPSKIYLTGGGSKLKNLDRYLSEELNLPVEKMPIPKNIDISRANIKNGDAVTLLPLIGAAMGYAGGINLLPHEYRVEKMELIEKVSLRMIAIIAAIILLFSFIFIKLRVDDYRYRLKNLKLQRDFLSQVKGLYDRMAEREDFLKKVRMSEMPLYQIKKELSNIVHPGIVFDSLSIETQNKVLNIRGVVYGSKGPAENALTRFMEDLEKSRYFKEAQLVSFQGSSPSGGEEISGFEINCLLE